VFVPNSPPLVKVSVAVGGILVSAKVMTAEVDAVNPSIPRVWCSSRAKVSVCVLGAKVVVKFDCVPSAVFSVSD
jgi:hypothetical protein